jgi:hypothetical protein
MGKGVSMWKAWIHEAPLEEFEANTLEELMSLGNEKYGRA